MPINWLPFAAGLAFTDRVYAIDMSRIVMFLLGLVAVLLTVTITSSETLQSVRPDCSSRPKDVICSKHSSYRAGNACTDNCLKELLDCSDVYECGCYCEGNLRKVEGECRAKVDCPAEE